jgi:hypothetical protein
MHYVFSCILCVKPHGSHEPSGVSRKRQKNATIVCTVSQFLQSGTTPLILIRHEFDCITGSVLEKVLLILFYLGLRFLSFWGIAAGAATGTRRADVGFQNQAFAT